MQKEIQRTLRNLYDKDWFSFANNEIRNQYLVTVRESLTLFMRILKNTLNEEYKKFVTTHIQAAEECI